MHDSLVQGSVQGSVRRNTAGAACYRMSATATGRSEDSMCDSEFGLSDRQIAQLAAGACDGADDEGMKSFAASSSSASTDTCGSFTCMQQSAREPQLTRQREIALRWAFDQPESDGHEDSSASRGKSGRLTFASFASIISRISRVSMMAETPPTNSLVVRHYTTFATPGLLRAGRLVDTLHLAGLIFRNAEGSAKTYEMSAGVREIDSFISHNWSTHRLLKFSALSVHFNFNYAVLTTTLALCLYVPLACFEWLPVLKMRADHPVGISCRVIGSCFFLFTAFSWHELARCFGYRGPTVFLDKVCIHQTDEVLKRRGVTSLAAFLCKSNRLVIIYADTYLRKLWTVYEVATYIILHPTRPIVILSPALCKMFVLGSIVMFFKEITKSYVNMTYFQVWHMGKNEHSHSLERMIMWISDSLPPSMLICLFLRRLARKHADMYAAAREFKIDTAACFDENDRPLVHKNITAFMKHQGLVKQQATQREALDVFNELVHREMPRRMDYIMGWTGIPYVYVAAMNLPSACNALDKVVFEALGSVKAHRKWSIYSSIALVAEKFGLTFAIYPLVMAVFALLTRRCLRLRGLSDAAFLTAVSLLFGLVSALIGYGQILIRKAMFNRPSDFALAVYLVFHILLFVFALMAYRPGRSDGGCFGVNVQQSAGLNGHAEESHKINLEGAAPVKAKAVVTVSDDVELVSPSNCASLLS